MAVAPASMADKIIILDSAEDESPQLPCTASTSSSKHKANTDLQLKAQQPISTHITQPPIATANKQANALLAKNQELFAEFVTHCSALTKDCPEVMTFLQVKHAKACPDFLSSVEFRNSLGRCIAHAQANRSKTFVYINELCTVLKQHAAKRRQTLVKLDREQSTSSSHSLESTSAMLKSSSKEKVSENTGEKGSQPALEIEQPSTSGLSEGNSKEEKKANRASRKQIAYLENLLKSYNEEICRLQQTELNLEEMEAEDSVYIQEHKLKRKMMKIYEKLCELKDCSTLTGRVIEQRISFGGTRYPEINRKIERFINSPEARKNPPDYPDILHLVQLTTKRHNLGLNKKQITQIAEEAFRETGSMLQERRHLDLVYNFGSHLTDPYVPSRDPALSDTTLLRKLRSNRETAMSRLEEVIRKFAVKQENKEDKERSKRQIQKSANEQKTKETNGVVEVEAEEEEEEEEEEDDEDEDDESSDPDIENEIKASIQQSGPENEDDSNEAEQMGYDSEEQRQEEREVLSERVSPSEENVKAEDDKPGDSTLSPFYDTDKSHVCPLSQSPSPVDSPSQSETVQPDQVLVSDDPVASMDSVSSFSHNPLVHMSTGNSSGEPTGVLQATTNDASTEVITGEEGLTQLTNGDMSPLNPRITRDNKRKRQESSSESPQKTKYIRMDLREIDIPPDMGAISCNFPQRSTRADTPDCEVVSSSQSTPPPKINKVHVSTQCDPQEIIVLSDSE